MMNENTTIYYYTMNYFMEHTHFTDSVNLKNTFYTCETSQQTSQFSTDAG